MKDCYLFKKNVFQNLKKEGLKNKHSDSNFLYI